MSLVGSGPKSPDIARDVDRVRDARSAFRLPPTSCDMPLPAPPSLRGKVAVVTGGSRGIGREVCLALARQGCDVVVAAKSATPQATLPGTIHTVAREVEAVGRSTGARALAVACDLRDERACETCVATAMARFGRIDILVNNASALWWQSIEDTPLKKYDLINAINARGAFVMAKLCAPHMRRNGWGRVICMGPPLPKTFEQYKNKTAYFMSKCGMSMVALGIAAEHDGVVKANALWPATVVESLASENFQLGSRKHWRKATILADCVVQLCGDERTNGQTLIDDEYLVNRGLARQELARYRCDPDTEPPRLLAEHSGTDGGGDWDVKRGSVKALREDRARSKL